MYVCNRPSIALQRLTACCRTIQYALSVLPGADLPYVVGQALFKEVRIYLLYAYQYIYVCMYVCSLATSRSALQELQYI